MAWHGIDKDTIKNMDNDIGREIVKDIDNDTTETRLRVWIIAQIGTRLMTWTMG